MAGVRGLIGGDCHARRYRLSTGARAGRLPVSDLDYVVCTDSVPVQQERHDLRFPGLGQRKEVPCLCGELRRFTKSEANITTILTANLPFMFTHRGFPLSILVRPAIGGLGEAKQQSRN